jgi:hypothetical protein
VKSGESVPDDLRRGTVDGATFSKMNITTDSEIIAYLKAKVDASGIPTLSLLASNGSAGFVASYYDHGKALNICECGVTADEAIAKAKVKIPSSKARAEQLRREAERLEAEAKELEAAV